jgi:hypothetical protein
MVPYLIADPSVGLYSATDASKGAVLNQKVVDGLAEMVRGHSPLSDLDQLLKDWRSSGWLPPPRRQPVIRQPPDAPARALDDVH